MSENKALTILAVGAHPDDIEFGCGGILAKEARRGSAVHLIVCSQGESGTNGSPEERRREAESAAGLLDAQLLFVEMGGDGLMERQKAHALRLAEEIRRVRPQVVLAPTSEPNQHPDHVVVGTLVAEAVRLARYGGLQALGGHRPWAVSSVLRYAIAPSGEPRRAASFLVEVGTVKDEWVALMSCHASQMKTRNYIDLQLARARSWGLQAGGDYAQALWSEEPAVAEHLGAIGRAARSF